MSRTSTPRSESSRATHAGASTGWMLAIGFIVLAIVLWFTSAGTSTPSAATPEFDRVALAIGPRRTMLPDPPSVVIAGYQQRCNACHRLFQSTWDGSRELTQHQHIALSHGTNDHCRNCHSQADRERLVLIDGSTIEFGASERLCAQCHALVYQDWQRGTHGKTLGAWDLSSALARRLHCAECHDPHAPAFGEIVPLPGPHTLRMGEPSGDGEHQTGARNPLRHWEHDHTGGHD